MDVIERRFGRGVIDDMMVRCIALKDGATGETVLFGTIDCIGITNADIRDIRELLKEFAKAKFIVEEYKKSNY